MAVRPCSEMPVDPMGDLSREFDRQWASAWDSPETWHVVKRRFCDHHFKRKPLEDWCDAHAPGWRLMHSPDNCEVWVFRDRESAWSFHHKFGGHRQGRQGRLAQDPGAGIRGSREGLTVRDWGTGVDCGYGDGSADLVVVVGGVSYSIDVRRTRKVAVGTVGT